MENFVISEFDSPDIPGSGINMKQEFLSQIVAARAIANIPFFINSGFRTEKQNEEVGGRNNSSHLTGQASDIHCANSVSRFIIVAALLLAGFKRIGIYPNFIHVDSDQSKPQNVIWTKL